jgi:enoyl-CoA hydratase
MINKVVPNELLMFEAERMASAIATQSPVAVQMAKESILKSMDMPLSDGLLFERRNYMTCFDTPEQKAKMNAFINK